MPAITPADALICAADYLTDTILGLVPFPTCMQDAVDRLMVIFKQQACATRDAATAQRVLRESAQAERVIKEEQQAHVQQESVQEQVIPSPSFEIEDNNDIADTPQGIPQITQDKHDSPPSANTQQQRETRTLTQEFMLKCMEYQNTRPHSQQNKQLQENTHCSFYVTLHMQSSTTRQATSLSTVTS
jgi:hypothetical protein